MSNDRVSRRGFIGTLVGAAATGLAGCVDSPSGANSTTSTGSAITSTDVPTATPTDGEPASEQATGDGSRFADVYQAVRDSVVQVRVRSGFGGTGTGTGFVYDESHLVTNEHVIANADAVHVRYRSTGWRDIDVKATDVYSDLAVLEVDSHPPVSEPLPLVETEPEIGTEVVAIGNPFGLSGTVSAGIVSGVDRTLAAPNNFEIPDTIQTDAAVNPGNSGGPLVDLQGRVVGVVSAGGGDNIGFGISAALAERVLPSLIETGSYDHPYLGIVPVNVTPAIADANDLSEATGVYVRRVLDGRPSDGVLNGATDEENIAGQTVPVGGDVITHIAGDPVPTTDGLASVLALETTAGEPADLRILRGGDEQVVTVPIGSRPQS